MKFFSKVKESFKGFVEKVKNVGQRIAHGVKNIAEKIKSPFKKEDVKIETIEVGYDVDYKPAIEKYILGLKDDFAIYYRKPNGQFDVYMYNVESLKWETLDIIEQMETAALSQFEEIQSIVKKVLDSSPSSKTEQDYKDMFANINAVLKGGKYVMQTLGPVSTDGTPFEEMDNKYEKR